MLIFGGIAEHLEIATNDVIMMRLDLPSLQELALTKAIRNPAGRLRDELELENMPIPPEVRRRFMKH